MLLRNIQLGVSEILLTSLLVALWCTASALHAQEHSLSDHEKMLKQGLDRLEHQIAPLRERPDVRLQQPKQATTNFSDIETAGNCFDISAIHLQGAEIISAALIEKATLPYLNQCLGLEHINALLGVISNLYLEQGYVTSRAYIAPQDLSDGSLDIVVMEGVIEGISSADGSISPTQLKWAFPAYAATVLNIRDIEQGVENLNTLGQNNATVALNPGAEQGGTQVVITNQLSKAWRGSLGINNSGVDSTGEYQLDGNLVFDNLLGVNDTSFFSASTNIGKHELPHALSRSYAMSWSMPVAYWQWSLQNSFYEYEQTVIGNVVNFSIHGSSLNSSIQLNRTLYRGQTGKLDLSASFIRKDSKNYIEDVFLETSSRTLYIWDLAGSYRHFLPQGTFSVNAHINKSVPWFDAKQQLVAAEDDFQFTKYQLNLGYNTQFHLGSMPVLYAVAADFLYSPKVILASEGLTVGGRYSVRGLSQSSLFGYKGGYIRNDFSLPSETSWPWLDQVQYYAGVDIGSSNLPEYPDRGSEWVAGSVVGIKLYDRNLSVNISYARALRVPDFLQQKQQEIDFSVRLSF
ncbi:MAG: hypothetical protein CVV11_21070 [Gammaproteobacteria bacterium HGW-Gammaproteobacteria-15]|nr:MAG: hypothetical protein CVV11_21070 [Gammaproteobacteria bacterium HGW-Gammaproteobacteria-15]